MHHPEHVHLSKTLIWSLEKQGRIIQIVASNKEIMKNVISINHPVCIEI